MFDPQKMDFDKHIDLMNTLGDMLGQKEESKRDKFIDTMPTIIQTHLITEKTWAKTTDKVKELEHIIRKCDPLAAALPTLAKGTTVPGLYSHIAHSDDKDEMDILQPFIGACPKQPKCRGGRKSKQPQQKPKNLPPQKQDDQHNYNDTYNYYHNENYRGQSRGCKYRSLLQRPKFFVAEANEIKIHTKAAIKMIAIKAIITRAIKDSIITHVEISLRVIAMTSPEVGAMAEAEAIITAVVTAGPIIKVMLIINTMSIMVMMMSTRQDNMVHHVHYAVAIITLPNIALRESMTSMILWKR